VEIAALRQQLASLRGLADELTAMRDTSERQYRQAARLRMRRNTLDAASRKACTLNVVIAKLSALLDGQPAVATRSPLAAGDPVR
jgi:hypothetical protein